jgi:endonuclease YncB( thermonuclease family)
VSGRIPQNTIYQRVKVIDVIDGDTIDVQFTDGITSTVRYIGIDAAESGLPFFEAARQANADLVVQKEVILVKDQSETDRFDRLLRYVVVGKVFVNQVLVDKGMAKAVNYPPDDAGNDVLVAAEENARQAYLGIWVATPTPEPSAGQVVIRTVNKREEWVDIQNVGNYDIDLAGWNLVSERGRQDCPLSGSLKAGETLRVWAMAAQGAGYSCGYNSPIWNNSEPDPALLYNAEGIEVSRK